MAQQSKSYRPFFLNLLIIILLTLAIFLGFFASLGLITRHGQVVRVPNITGLNGDVALQKLSDLDLDVEILDSVYYDSLPRLSVVSQFPTAGTEVKKGRIIYFTINRAIAPLVQVPDITGYSLPSATLLLKSFGLKLGGYSYTASMVRGAVVGIKINDSNAVPNIRVPVGTAIYLVLGDGSGGRIVVPNITGMQLYEARAYLATQHCSIGAVTADINVMRIDSAYIYKQLPIADSGKMRTGGNIDVWVSNSPKINISTPPPAEVAPTEE